MIEVRNPTLDAKVKIDVPTITTVEGYSRMFTRTNVIALCLQSFRKVPDWKEVIEREIGSGKVLELAWRMDTNLDWVWLEDDVYGQQRGWVVLCGLAFKQVNLMHSLKFKIDTFANRPTSKFVLGITIPLVSLNPWFMATQEQRTHFTMNLPVLRDTSPASSRTRN